MQKNRRISDRRGSPDNIFWQTYQEYCDMKQQDEVIKYQVKNEHPTDAGSETGIELEPGYENKI